MMNLQQRGTPLQAEGSRDNLESSKTQLNGEFPESDRCACCFTLQGVVISSITFLIIIAILLFALDLTILDAERRYRFEKELDHGYKTKLEQDGGKFEEELTYENYEYLKIIDLQNVEANITQLVRFIYFASSLEILRLRNMKFTGKVPKTLRGRPYLLYDLKEFTLDFTQEIGPGKEFQLDPCDTCVFNPFDSKLDFMRQVDCIKSLLMFIMNERIVDNILNYQSAETKIQILLGGWNLFKILPNEGEVTIMFEDCDEMLRNLLDQFEYFKFKKLGLSGCRNLSMSTLQRVYDRGYLKHLVLDTVSFTGVAEGKRFSQIFRNMDTLEELVLKNGNLYSSSLNPNRLEPIEIEFSDFPISLKKLSILNAKISANFIGNAVHLSLDTLALNMVNFDHLAFQLFLNVVEYRKIGIRFNNIHLEASPIDRLTVLNKITENRFTEWILFTNGFNQVTSYSLRTQTNRPWVNWLVARGVKQLTAFAFTFTRSGGSVKWGCEKELTPNEELGYWYEFLSMDTFFSKEASGNIHGRVW